MSWLVLAAIWDNENKDSLKRIAAAREIHRYPLIVDVASAFDLRRPSPRPPAGGWATRIGDETLSKALAFIRRGWPPLDAMTTPGRLTLGRAGGTPRDTRGGRHDRRGDAVRAGALYSPPARTPLDAMTTLERYPARAGGVRLRPCFTGRGGIIAFTLLPFWSIVNASSDALGGDMLDRAGRALLWTGAVLLAAVSVLFGDTAAGMRAFSKKDYPAAYREWKAAAEQGQAEAQYNLGMLYLKGLGVARDPDEAFRWLRLAADQGQADAEFQVGLMLEKGVGVRQNYAEARFWLALAAERGDSEAEAYFAAQYEQGQGVPKDLARAVRWYLLAADQGLPDAQYHLGLLAERGRGVPRDFAEATKWYACAADQGHVQAQFRLGSCYAVGKGVNKDQLRAYFWLTVASKQDDKDAEKQRSELAPKLSPDDITKTELSAAAWKPKPAQVQKPAAER